MKAKVGQLLAVMALCATANGTETAWFNVTFGDYAEGQSVSATGVTGGTWQGSSLASATNVYNGARNGIVVNAFSESDLRFVPSQPAEPQDVDRVDFSLCSPKLEYFADIGFDGAAGFTPALRDDGTPGFFGFAKDRWVELFSENVTPAAETWLDGRIELRTQDGVRMVRYLVKNGDSFEALKDAAGTEWFRTTAPSNGVNVSSISFTGSGRFSDFSGREDAGDAWRLYRWIGGDSGDWDALANWTVDGEAATALPSAAGDIALVDGSVALTQGSDTADVTDLTIGFSDGGQAQLMGGELTTPVTVDTSRPRAGTALSVTTGTFLGLGTSCDCTWTRGSTAKSYESTPVCTAASYAPTADDYDHWFKVVAKNGGSTLLEHEFFFSKLPVFYMTTDDGQTPSANKEKHDGVLYAQGNDEWDSIYNGAMTINVRGNSTKSYPKKPWKIKLDKKTAMFGIDKSKHWVLLANYNDQSMLRNKLAADFANDIGSSGMRSTWVECILNGEWQGTYHFGEQVRIAKERVNIHDWEGDAGDIAEKFAKAHGLTGDQEDELAEQLEQNFSWVTSDSFTFATNGVTLTGQPSKLFKKYTNDITGGYLFEFSEEYDEVTKFTTTSGKLGVRTMLKSPEYLYTNNEMLDYCKDYLQKYWDACTSVDGQSGEGKSIAYYSDYETMVNYWLVMELFGNTDAVKKSRYAYKDQGGKLVWGPVWDFDWGVGSPRVDTTATEWECQEQSGKTAYSFFKEWADDPYFCTRLHTRYWQVRDRFAQCIEQDGLIDQYTNYLNEACQANSAKWDWYYKLGAGGFAADVARLRTYLTTRLTWLDAQFASVPTLMASLKQSTSTHPYTADATALPIAFTGTFANGSMYAGNSLEARFTPVGSSIATVSCIVNGELVVEKQALSDGVFDAVIPAEYFTSKVGEPNCVAFIAYNSSGTVVARNYALVSQTSPSSVLIIR